MQHRHHCQRAALLHASVAPLAARTAQPRGPPRVKEIGDGVTRRTACLVHVAVVLASVLRKNGIFWHLIGAGAGRPAAVGAPLVDHVLAGYNGSALAYGQTGSGKTHTMTGAPPEHVGAPVSVLRQHAALAATLMLNDGCCPKETPRLPTLGQSGRTSDRAAAEPCTDAQHLRRAPAPPRLARIGGKHRGQACVRRLRVCRRLRGAAGQGSRCSVLASRRHKSASYRASDRIADPRCSSHGPRRRRPKRPEPMHPRR